MSGDVLGTHFGGFWFQLGLNPVLPEKQSGLFRFFQFIPVFPVFFMVF